MFVHNDITYYTVNDIAYAFNHPKTKEIEELKKKWFDRFHPKSNYFVFQDIQSRVTPARNKKMIRYLTYNLEGRTTKHYAYSLKDINDFLNRKDCFMAASGNAVNIEIHEPIEEEK